MHVRYNESYITCQSPLQSEGKDTLPIPSLF